MQRISPTDTEALVKLLAGLYQRQREQSPDHSYFAFHSTPKSLLSKVRTFQWYFPSLEVPGRILDWGCFHAPDSCLLRATLGPDVELFGCDLNPPDVCAEFHSYARFDFRHMEEASQVPFPDSFFDVVLGSGTLEHVANDWDLLKEIHRVLRPGGRFVISHLPNRWSVAEWKRRNLDRRDFHRRLYTLREIRNMLVHSGFWPLEAGYHSSLDRLSPDGLLRRVLRGVRYALPLHWFVSTLCVRAEKVVAM